MGANGICSLSPIIPLGKPPRRPQPASQYNYLLPRARKTPACEWCFDSVGGLLDEERKERLQYFGFAGFVGLLLLLNLTGIWKTIFGIDTAAILTVLAGYRIFYNSISALLEKEISADLAICIAVVAALSVGEYLAAAEAMFIMLVGEALEHFAVGRTRARRSAAEGQAGSAAPRT